MKQTLKATAAIIGIIAAGWLVSYAMQLIGCLMIYISETCNVPL